MVLESIRPDQTRPDTSHHNLAIFKLTGCLITKEQELNETRASFRKDNGIPDQIMNMRLICEKQIEHNKNVHCCLIDYSKAFDCVDFELTWMTLFSFGIQKYLVECLKDLYQHQRAELDTAVGRTGPLSLQRLSTFTNAV